MTRPATAVTLPMAPVTLPVTPETRPATRVSPRHPPPRTHPRRNRQDTTDVPPPPPPPGGGPPVAPAGRVVRRVLAAIAVRWADDRVRRGTDLHRDGHEPAACPGA